MKINKLIRFVGITLFVIAGAVSCDKEKPEDNKTVFVYNVVLDKNELELTPGAEYTLTATVQPENATNKDITWHSSNTEVATVVADENGKATVKAIAVGDANIVVTTDDAKLSKTCTVTVVAKEYPVTGVTLTPSEATINSIGGTVELHAVIAPENATNTLVQFITSNPEVASVDGNGKVTAKAIGTTTITVKTSDGAFTAKCEITVDIPITGVTLDITEKTLYIGDDFNLVATIEPEDAVYQTITWESSDAQVATVDQNGKVTAIGGGTANITVTVDGKFTAKCAVTVSKLTSVTLNTVAYTLYPNNVFDLIVSFLPADAEHETIIWTSDNTNVAVVNESGRVSAINTGTANITVTVDGRFTATCKITVITNDLVVRKELRAVWIATVWALDWPDTPPNGEAAQKQKYINYLDEFAAANINAVVMQVRGMADPYWKSQYESWSYRLAGGTAGNGNEPSYDVMRFLIDEAHKRNIEFHAWFNPFRITTGTNYSYQASGADPFANMDPKIPRDLVKDYPGIRMYNPAIPAAHQRIADIVEEFLDKYPEVDGISFDDYFYPQISERPSNGDLMDAAEFNQYKGSFITIGDWRFDNVDKVIQKVHNVIVTKAPHVVFSISPQANEGNNNDLYANVLKWCQQKWIDLVVPQMYGGYSSWPGYITAWKKYGDITPLLAGMPFYRILNASDGNFPVSDFDNMFDLSRKTPWIVGHVQYKALDFGSNRGGSTDVLRSYYKEPALRPLILPPARRTAAPPLTPQNAAINGNVISWTQPASDLTSVVYHIPEGKTINDAYIVKITKDNSITVTEKGEYLLTTFNSDNVESAPTGRMEN